MVPITTQRYQELLEQFRVWCQGARGRQTQIAAQLGVSSGRVNDWIAGRRDIPLNAWTQIESIIQLSKGKTMSRSSSLLADTRAAKTPSAAHTSHIDDDEPKKEFRNLADAREEIQKLRTRIAQLGGNHLGAPSPAAAPTAPATLPARATLPTPIAPAKPAANPFAKIPVSDLLSQFHAAEKDGKTALASLLRTEIVARATPPNNRPPPAKLLLPQNPRDLRAFCDGKSTAELKELLSSAESSEEKFLLYKILKSRGE